MRFAEINNRARAQRARRDAEFVRCRDALKAITTTPAPQPAAPAEVTP